MMNTDFRWGNMHTEPRQKGTVCILPLLRTPVTRLWWVVKDIWEGGGCERVGSEKSGWAYSVDIGLGRLV